MKKHIDYCRTQVLLPSGPGEKPRYFVRHTVSVLVDRDGRVLREMDLKAWCEFHKQWPAEVQEDGLDLRSIWALKEVQV